MDQNPHIFSTRGNKHIQEINIHFSVTLNHFGTMILASDQKQNDSYTLKGMLFSQDKLEFILAIIKEVEAYEYRTSAINMKRNMGSSIILYSFGLSGAIVPHMEV